MRETSARKVRFPLRSSSLLLIATKGSAAESRNVTAATREREQVRCHRGRRTMDSKKPAATKGCHVRVLTDASGEFAVFHVLHVKRISCFE